MTERESAAERETLARIIRNETGEAEEEAGFVADAILAAGFCRPKEPAPDVAALREMQREYTEKRNHCYVLIRRQDQNLSNCSPGIATIQACRKQADGWRADAERWQTRIDAIQNKLDEAVGLEQ